MSYSLWKLTFKLCCLYSKTTGPIQSFTRKTIAILKSFQMLRNCNVVTDSKTGVCQLKWVSSPREFYPSSSE